MASGESASAGKSQGLMKLALGPTVTLNLYPETQHIQMELR